MTAVVAICHGTVERPEDVPAFLANIRRGRPAPPDLVAEVTRRLEVIGGSPLMRITREQAAALEARLGIPVAVAGRLWGPYPDEVLRELASRGVRRVVSLPLAPQSVHVYHEAVHAAARGLEGLEVVDVPSYGLEPALVDAFVETVDEGLARMGPPAAWTGSASRPAIETGSASRPAIETGSASRPAIETGSASRPAIVLSAHSLPARVLASGDPYERDFRAMAGAVAERLAARGLVAHVAFQSAGATNETWLGPDLPATFARLVAEGTRAVLVAPIGFVAEHVETLYDLDVEAPTLARAAGVEVFGRAPAVGARPRFIDALEAVVRRASAG